MNYYDKKITSSVVPLGVSHLIYEAFREFKDIAGNNDISSIVENFSTTTLIKRIFDRIFGLDCSLTTVNQDNEGQYVVFKFSLSSYDVSFKEVAKLIQFSSLYPRIGNKFLQIIEDEETRCPTFTFLVHRDDFKHRKNANNETI